MKSRIVTKVDADLGLTEFFVSGTPTSEDFVRAICEHYRDHPTPLTIWDLTSASFSFLEPAGFSAMASAANAFADDRGGHPKTAVIINGNIECILGRLFKDVSDANASAVSYNIVTTREEAVAWLIAAE